MTGNIDMHAFEFVKKLKAKIMVPNPEQSKPVDQRFKGMGEPLDLGEINNFKITQFDETDLSWTGRTVDVDGKMVSLSGHDFIAFRDLLLSLLESEPYQSLCESDFIIDNGFDWLITVYKNQKAASTVTNYLLEKLNSVPIDHDFYFKIESFEIEESFKIAGTSFEFFTDESILSFYNNSYVEGKSLTFEKFKDFYKYNFERINLKVTTKGESGRAEQIAVQRAELAVDILKCFCIQYSIQQLVLVFDLDYRLDRTGNANFIHIQGRDYKNNSLQWRNNGGVAPIRISKELLEQYNRKGLQKISDFIIQHSNTELYFEIISLIKQLGVIVSTRDHYEKIAKTISLVESFIVPRTSTGRAKGLTRIKAALPKLIDNPNDREVAVTCFQKFYPIRDKYLHNYTRIPIDQLELFLFIDFTRVLIVRLIDFTKTMTTLDEVLAFMEPK